MWNGLTRRGFATGVLAGVALRETGIRSAFADDTANLTAAWSRLEQETGGRLGISLLDTGTGRRWGHRAGERFPFCSTFKLLAAAAILAKVDRGGEDLGRRIAFGRGDLVTYSPITEKHADGSGMTLAELCEAAMTLSDNTAANLILASLGGPAGLTAFARSLGDPATRLDRIETELNEATPGDPRDTTTPDAMAANLNALAVGSALSPGSRRQLVAWMTANRTGDEKVRAGLPTGWTIGDKTGSGGFGTTNDVAVIWPPGTAPLVLCIYVTDTKASLQAKNATIAGVARSVASIVRL